MLESLRTGVTSKWFKPMVKRDTDLPHAITKKLRTKSIPDSLRFQLVDSKFGQMLVELLAVKKGGIKIPFAKVKDEIVKNSIGNWSQFETPTTWRFNQKDNYACVN
jgi:hypothetical protein